MNRSTGWIVLVWAMCGSFGCTTQPATAPKESAADQGSSLVGDSKRPDDAEPTISEVEEDEDEKAWPPHAGAPPRSGDEQVAVAERPLYNSLWDRHAGTTQEDRDGHIVYIGLDHPTDKLLLQIAALPRLRELWLFGTPRVSVDSLKALGDVLTLEDLHLSQTPNTNSALSAWSRLTRLKRLSLDECGVTDDAVVVIDRFRDLEHLSLSGNMLSDAAINAVVNLTKLQSLSLGDNGRDSRSMRITDNAMQKLAGLQAITNLQLNDQPLTGAGLRHLPALPLLSFLVLGGPTIRDDVMAPLADCQSLRHLLLHNTQVTDEGLSQIDGLANLELLHLQGGPFTDAGIAHLGRLKHLKKLSLFGSKLTDESLEHVSHLDSLQDLWIQSSNGGNGPSPKFTAAGYAHLARMKHLRLLCLKDVDINPAVPTLCEMTWLRTLFLDETRLSQQSLRQLWDSPLRRKTNGKGGLPDPDLPREAR